MEPQILMALGSASAGGCNLLLLLPRSAGFGSAVASRGLVGAALALVYPPAMRCTATWFTRGRGVAMGAVIGALTVGSAAPALVRGLTLSDGSGDANWQAVVYATSALGFAGAVLSLVAVRRGPVSSASKGRVDFSLLPRVLRNRRAMLATLGYWGHQWELYSAWAWLGTFLKYSAERGGADAGAGADGPAAWGAFVAFGAIGSGVVGCLAAGVMADRLGRPQAVLLANGVSGACAVLIGVCAPTPWASALIAHAWGATVIADSAQYSAMVTEFAEPELAGTALSFQMASGYIITIVGIVALPSIQEALTWRYAFATLAPGAAVAACAMLLLLRLKHQHDGVKISSDPSDPKV